MQSVLIIKKRNQDTLIIETSIRIDNIEKSIQKKIKLT